MELKTTMFKKMLPLPVTLITTVNGDGVVNGAPYSCVMPILNPFDLITIASALPRDTLKNIRDTGEFVVNVMGEPSLGKAMECAANVAPDVDELALTGLETMASQAVRPPRVKDAVGWIEAMLEKEVLGEGYSLIIGKVLKAEINDDYFKDGVFVKAPAILLIPELRAIDPVLLDTQLKRP